MLSTLSKSFAALVCALLAQFAAAAAHAGTGNEERAGARGVCAESAVPLPRAIPPHETLLATTPWPVDLTEEAVLDAYRFVARHAGLIVHQLDNGVPWKEALHGRPFARPVMEDWETRRALTPEDMPILLALTPLNMARDGLAPFWDARGDEQPLDGQWKRKRFDDEEVEAAYLDYVRRAIEYFHPRYLAIGIESNILISKAPEKWAAYLALNAHVYREIKRAFPDLPVFATVQYEHLRGIDDDAKANLDKQVPGVRALLEHSDLMALSTYRFGIHHPNPMNEAYFDLAESFGRPVAIAEMGALSASVHVFGLDLDADEADQARFVAGALAHATARGYPFVVNWVGQDFTPLVARLPAEARDFASLFAHMGLATARGRTKPVLAIWDAYLRAASKAP